MDMDTFITTLYVIVDDLYKAEISEAMKRHAGPALRLTDSEVLTIAIAGQWRVGVPWQSERGVVRYMQGPGRVWFPQMLGSSQFNQRVRQLWAALVRVQQLVAERLERGEDEYESVDCVPLPSCSLSQAASYDRHWLSGSLGRGGNQGGWFYGEQALTSVTASGVITGWLVGMAHVDDRWMLEAFLSTRQAVMQVIGPPPAPQKQHETRSIPSPESFSPALSVGRSRGLPYVVDQGFNGGRWVTHWAEAYGDTVIAAPPATSPQAWSPADRRWLARHRQIVETVFARLTDVFGLKRLRAHSAWGRLARLAATMAAYNLGIFLNRLCGRPDGALATLIT